jgi:hypothetical protein
MCKVIWAIAKQEKDVYAYYDNDQLGNAAFSALTLQKFVTKSSAKNKHKKFDMINILTRRQLVSDVGRRHHCGMFFVPLVLN